MDHSASHSHNGAGHETTEVNVKTIVVSLAFLAVGTFLVCMLVVGIFRFFNSTYHPDVSAQQSQPQVPPEPRLEVAPARQIIDLRAREDHILSTYSWIDKNAGTVRVPIDRAIDMLAQKGLPAHDYMGDIEAGRKPAPGKAQGSTNAGK
jgi:hypothetical protein